MLEQFRLIVVDDEKPQLEALTNLIFNAVDAMPTGGTSHKAIGSAGNADCPCGCCTGQTPENC